MFRIWIKGSYAYLIIQEIVEEQKLKTKTPSPRLKTPSPRLKRVLKPKGLLFFRVNSVKDVNYGAGEGKEIEPHLYETDDGRLKRFFDLNDIQKFFANWDKLYIHEEVMSRYGAEKVLWRGALKVNK